MQVNSTNNNHARDIPDEFEIPMVNKHCKLYGKSNPDGTKDYDVYISGMIDQVHNYTDLLNILFSAETGDKVFLKINSVGGYLDTGLEIQDAIKSSHATVIGILSANASSAASGILLACDGYIIKDGAYMLVHGPTTGSIGPVRDIEDETGFLRKQAVYWISTTYKNFLTEEEMEDVLENKRQMYLTAEDIRQRLERKEELDALEYVEVEGGAEEMFPDPMQVISDMSETLHSLVKKIDATNKELRAVKKLVNAS